jgi:hypothetical protein
MAVSGTDINAKKEVPAESQKATRSIGTGN